MEVSEAMVARVPGSLSITEPSTKYELSLLIGTKNLCLRTPEERRANMGDGGEKNPSGGFCQP